MAGSRPFALVRTRDQWLRCAHQSTAFDDDGAVQLDWAVEDLDPAARPPPAHGAGLAFDSACRLFHSLPAQGAVERVLWAAEGAEAASSGFLGETAEATPGGDFRPQPPRAPLGVPRGLAVDGDDRLFVADPGRRRVHVYDLWGKRLLRSAACVVPDGASGDFAGDFAGHEAGAPAAALLAARPLAVACAGDTAYVVTSNPPGLFEMSARRGPAPLPVDPRMRAPHRVACSPGGRVAVLDSAGTADATVFPLDHPDDAFAVPFASDLAFESDEVLVVATGPDGVFLRYTLAPGRVGALSPLRARGYDGLGIARTPEARPRFVYWTSKGPRHAVPARVQFAPRGRVTTFRLDSGQYRTQWGRLFLDACIPPGTQVRAHCIALDEPEGMLPTLPPSAPGKLVHQTLLREDLTPPLPPQGAWPEGPLEQHLHRRETGCELPLGAPGRPPEPFATWEAPVDAPMGRYLWVVLELLGTRRASPKIRCLRAEYPTHELVRRLPRAWSREEATADFLRRFLAPFDGMLSDLDGRAALRQSLLLAHAAPPEALEWLASFVGLALDRRWSERARRTFIEEAAALFRRRGTKGALERMLQIALELGRPPVIVERFRLRGMGGAMLSDAGPATSNAVLGGGFRVGGAIGDAGVVPLEGAIEDAFRTHAHRFSVVVPRALGAEERALVTFLLEAHRPAHTVYDVCTVDAGMRVGLGLHLELSSVVGRTGGFDTLQLGGSALGRGTLLGRPGPGLVPGQGRVGRDARVG